MDAKRALKLRARIAYLAVIALGIAVITKGAYIQLIEGDHWKKIALINRLACKTLSAIRGDIYASEGNLLATSRVSYRVAMDPCIASKNDFEEQVTALSYCLSNYFKKKEAAYYETLLREGRASGKKYVLFDKQRISYHDKKIMESWPLFDKGRYNGGVIFEAQKERFKPFKELARRTIGFINDKEQGAGIEYSFNELLKGKDGQGVFKKTVGGTWRLVPNGTHVLPKNGYDVESTIDIHYQDIAHHALLEGLKENDADHGCVIVMEVKTGEIKAIVNLSKRGNGQYAERYNYAVASQGCQEPGSTFKLASVIALLEETHLDIDETMVETGSGIHQFHDVEMKDVWKKGLGTISLREVIEQSSNVGIAKLIEKYFGTNPRKFISYLNDLGLTRPLGFQLWGEGKPNIQTPDDVSWNAVTLPWMAIGYALEVTPLQVLALFNAVANNGKMIRPLLVKKIKNGEKTVKSFKTSIINHKICSDSTLIKVKQMLEGVVERGTARRIKNPYYRSAGKSGTAKHNKHGRYIQRWRTSFAGYFPAESPKYSCIVMIDNPKKFFHGSDASAPVFKQIADRLAAKDPSIQDFFSSQTLGVTTGIFPIVQAGKKNELITICKNLNIPHESTAIKNKWVRAEIKDDKLVWKGNAYMQANKVPNLQGMTLKDALYLLENRGFRVLFKGRGRVYQQSILPGARVKRGEKILLTLK